MVNYFANNLRYLRKKSGKNQEEWGFQLNIKRATLSNYESGITEPDLNKLLEISNFTGISIQNLLSVDLSKVKGNEIQEDENLREKGKVKGKLLVKGNSKNLKNYEVEDHLGSHIANEETISKIEHLYQSQINTLNNLITAKDTIIAQLSADNNRLKRDIETLERAIPSNAQLIPSKEKQ